MISATTGDGVADIKRALAESTPEAPWHSPTDQLSDATDRMVAAELTREQITSSSTPSCPIVGDRNREMGRPQDGSTVIHQQIWSTATARKQIVLGKGGSRLKSIGQAAREAIGEHLGRKVHLFLHVKVNPRWDETARSTRTSDGVGGVAQ